MSSQSSRAGICFLLTLFEHFLTERTKREANTSASFPVPESFTGKQVSMGLETMNEQADKRNFFRDEEEGLLDVDYNKKLAEISTSESVSPDGYVGDTMLCFDENKRLILEQLNRVNKGMPCIKFFNCACAWE